MKLYKESSFQDRRRRAAEAKAKALEQLRSRPPVSAGVRAERMAASLKRDAVQAGKATAKAARKRAVAEADALARASLMAQPSEADRKAQRDARYAARKRRK
jgi:hypothetical protein